MLNLQNLQNNFQNYLLDKPSVIEKNIVDVQPVPAAIRLAIYKEGYYLRLLEALEQDYEVLRALLGADAFDELGRDYIQAYPSHFRSIRWYGKELPLFLKQKINSSALLELAEFEWLLTEAFDAVDSGIVTEQDMAAVPFEQWPMMRLTLHPSLRQLTVCSNAIALWRSYKEASALPALQYSDTSAPWIIWRKQNAIQFCSLTASESYILNTISAGASFAEVCEGLTAWIAEQDVALHAALFLKRLILDELVVKIIIDGV